MARALAQNPRLAGAELIDGFFEKRIALGDRFRPSQADLVALLGLDDGLAVMAVEGKVRESFGPLVGDWLESAAASSQRLPRLERLAHTLGLDTGQSRPLRYQLIHRTASAVYEARRYRAKVAVMMVHSFDPGGAGVVDYVRFAAAVGVADAGAGTLSGPVFCEGIELYLGWTSEPARQRGDA